MNNNRWYLLFFLLLIALSVPARAIELKKLFHHKGGTAHAQGKSIEMGSIVLYLDQNPQVIKSTTKNGEMTNYHFFLPSVQLSNSQLQSMIDAINQTQSSDYRVTISMKSKPSHGMEIVLAFNEKKVGVVQNSFDAITLDKGIVLRLFDKKLIKHIGKQSKPIIQTAANTRPRVLIDCGHGGKDDGAVGCNGIKEKNICLQVGLEIAGLLKKKHVDALLTREIDTTLSLDDRTLCANSNNIDLFISVHANSGNPRAAGIETYCLNNALFSIHPNELLDGDQSSFLEKLNNKYQKSISLASLVQSQLVAQAVQQQAVIDRKVKYAASQVLIGATMPAILVEIGFVTNPDECALLATPSYQKRLAQGVVNGLDKYLELETLV